MRESLSRRLTFVASILAILGMLIVYRLVTIQFGINTAYFTEAALTEYRYKVTVHPPRGEIYDRNGVLMATNALEYEIGMSPVLIYDRETTAEQLAPIVGKSKEELLDEMSRPTPYVLLMRPAPAVTGQAVINLNLDGVTVTPINRRFYPHGSLAAHELGFVGYDEVGYYGIEGYYNEALSGKVQVSDESRIPFEASGGEGLQPGSKLYLTLDSEIQYLAETTLAQGLSDTGAQSGTIIVMNPRTGEILAMASLPTFDPNQFYNATDASVFANPAVSHQYEPGSTVKVATMGIALDTGATQPDSTYDDTATVEVGGATIYNWDRQGHGITSMTDLLGRSLNVGAAKLSLAIGPIKFYHGFDAFGFGKTTGVDLEGEAAGLLKKPGQTDWHESDLAENSFGQALATTPIQVITALGSVANGGLMMQPHIVARKVDPDGTVTVYNPATLGRTVTQQTAGTLNQMLVDALHREGSQAAVPGYAIAGKTGTAQIPIPGGYDPDKTIASFVGWGPADDPRFIVLIKLDKPTSSPFGSQTAAPLFAKFVGRLVVLMEIPPDTVRLAPTGG